MLPVATEMIKQLPGYKVILKAILKAQIQMLVDQLLAETDEETVVLTASLTDGTLSDLGSAWGRNFLEGQEEFKTQFLCHCLKGNQTHDNTDAPDIQKSTTVLQKRASQRFSHSALMPTDQNSKRQNTSLPTESFLQPADNIDGIGDDELSHNTAISVIQNQENEDSLMSEENELENHDSERDEHYTDVVDDKSIKTEQDIENIAALAANNSKGCMPSEVEETQLSLDQNELQSVRGQSEPPCNILSEVVDKADEDSIVVKVEPEDNDDAVSDVSQSFHEPVPSASQGGERKKRIVRGSRDVQKAVSSNTLKKKLSFSEGESIFIRTNESFTEEDVDTAAIISSTPSKNVQIEIYKSVDESQNTINQNTIVPPSKTTTNKERQVHRCDGCSYKSYYLSNLHRHREAVHKNKKHNCAHCNRNFVSMYYMKQHERSFHRNLKLMCEHCAKVFNVRNTLNLHKRIIHGNKKRFSCMICMRHFYDKAHYQGHINKHMDNRAYQCKECSKSFIYKSNLKRHEKNSHGEVDEDRYCELCDKTFKNKSSLQDHKVGKHGNKESICICGRRYSWRSSYSRHIKNCRHYNA